MKKRASLFAVSALVALLAIPSGMAFAADASESEMGSDELVASEQVMPLANTKDEHYQFTFNKVGATAACDRPRAKDNRTPSYVLVEKMTCDRCRAYIDQSSSGSWVNVTSQGKATIKKPGEFFIYVTSSFSPGNLVRFTGWADSTTGIVSGEWSPDSVGSFPSINGN